MIWEPLIRGKNYAALRHRGCGASGEEGARVHSMINLPFIFCQHCMAQWKAERWRFGFSAEEMAERFEGLLFPEGEERPARAVWIHEQNGTMHGGLITGSDLAERKGVLEDGREWEAYMRP